MYHVSSSTLADLCTNNVQTKAGGAIGGSTISILREILSMSQPYQYYPGSGGLRIRSVRFTLYMWGCFGFVTSGNITWGVVNRCLWPSIHSRHNCALPMTFESTCRW